MVHLLAPNAAILPIRVLGADGAGTTFAIARGIHHAVRQGADVINLSVAMVETSTVIETALDGALEAGVIVVAASGNDGADVVSFPAKHDGVVAVAAVDTAGVRAPFSNVGREVALSAPGVALISSYGEFGLAAWEGTSFAAPMVSGAAGLLLDKYPGLTPPQVRDLLRATAQPDANSTLEGMMGAGILDADALTAALTADRTSLELDAAVDGTHLRWSPVLGATRYDAARGDLAVLRAWAAAGGADALLGPLACLADDLPTAEAPALVDNVAPAPGQAFFYVFRDDAGGRDYGRDSAGRLRLAVDTDCSASE